MKIRIEAKTQEEFDSKRDSIIKALSGQVAGEPREPHYAAQKEIFKHWDTRFKEVIESIKREVDEVIRS